MDKLHWFAYAAIPVALILSFVMEQALRANGL